MKTILCLICGHEFSKDRISKRILGDGKAHDVCDECRRDVLGEKE